MPTRDELIYFASVIDCEGTITARQNKTTGNYEFFCAVANTNPILVDWLVRTFGGNVSVYKYKGDRGLRWKDHIKWRLHGKRMFSILKETSEHLKLKLQQFHMVKAMNDIQSRTRSHPMLHVMSSKLSELNRRGMEVGHGNIS